MLFAKARKIKRLTAQIKELEERVESLENEKTCLEKLIHRKTKKNQRLTRGLYECSPYIESELFFKILTDAVNEAYD